MSGGPTAAPIRNRAGGSIHFCKLPVRLNATDLGATFRSSSPLDSACHVFCDEGKSSSHRRDCFFRQGCNLRESQDIGTPGLHPLALRFCLATVVRWPVFDAAIEVESTVDQG